jgi:hypothetical protein
MEITMQSFTLRGSLRRALASLMVVVVAAPGALAQQVKMPPNQRPNARLKRGNRAPLQLDLAKVKRINIPFQNPPDAQEINGHYDLNLTTGKFQNPGIAGIDPTVPDWFELLCYNGSPVGPTIRVKRGTTLRIHLKNDLKKCAVDPGPNPSDNGNPYEPPEGTTYDVSVSITDPSGQPGLVKSIAVVAPATANLPFAGGIDPLSDHGPFTNDGVTNTNSPIFSGAAPAFSTIQLFARRSDIDTTLPLGQAATDASGHWSLPTGPLSDGIYTITAIVTPPGGSPSSMTLLSNNGRVIIDTVAPRVTGIEPLGRGRFVVVFQDNLSGMSEGPVPSPGTILNPASYTFAGPGRLVVPVASVVPWQLGGLPTDPQAVLVTALADPRTARRLRYLRISGMGITDVAGNTLQSDYHHALPSASGLAGGNFLAKLGPHGTRKPRSR